MKMKIKPDEEEFAYNDAAGEVEELVQIFYKREFDSSEALINVNKATMALNSILAAIVRA